MTDTINNGGLAFPCGLASGHIDPLHPGMTLRDYFAAKAMPLVLPICLTYESAASEAYKVADAMLRAREVK